MTEFSGDLNKSLAEIKKMKFGCVPRGWKEAFQKLGLKLQVSIWAVVTTAVMYKGVELL